MSALLIFNKTAKIAVTMNLNTFAPNHSACQTEIAWTNLYLDQRVTWSHLSTISDFQYMKQRRRRKKLFIEWCGWLDYRSQDICLKYIQSCRLDMTYFKMIEFMAFNGIKINIQQTAYFCIFFWIFIALRFSLSWCSVYVQLERLYFP